MTVLDPHPVLASMAATIFFLGAASFLAGLSVLALRAAGRDVKALATQTGELAAKGLAEDIAGLVGNAAVLMDSLDKLVRTATGVGVFLVMIGLLLMTAGAWFATRIYGISL